MKKTVFVAFSLVFVVMFMSTPLFSATVDDLVGIWETYNVSKLKISGVGSRTAENNTTTILTDDMTFTMHEVDSTGTYDYTGNWGLIKDGKKMHIGLDTNGRSKLITMWEKWLMEIAQEYGVSIGNISLSVESLTISEPGLPKKTNIPKKATIKAKGLVSATVDGEPLTKKFSYTSKVTFLSRQTGTAEGLQADYSNGMQAFEGPIDHGYGTSCSSDPLYDHNLYQGICTLLSELPVNWAMGGWTAPAFSVSWTGCLLTPADGDYHFYGWVDGTVHVEINGQVVADLATTGGSYGQTIALPGGGCVPVTMSFSTNGGSNNMYLGWLLPGASAGEVVPRAYLKH